MKTTLRYSQAFKKQVVEEIAGGKFKSANQARRAYGIRGTATVTRWVEEYGREDLLPKRIRIETMKERDELKPQSLAKDQNWSQLSRFWGLPHGEGFRAG